MQALFQQFFEEECSEHVNGLIRAAIAAARSGTGVVKKTFEFNRFEVTVDVANGVVLLEDILEPEGIAHAQMSLPDFEKTLR